MTIYEKLLSIQTELNAPKSKFNSFGNYHYRSLEDITEALKPLLKKNNMTLFMQDDVVNVGDRYYIEASATLVNNEDGKCIEVSAKAREALTKKGMDEAQISGASSSFARKYCLAGLFLADSSEPDIDSEEYQKKAIEPENKKPEKVERAVSQEMKIKFMNMCAQKGIDYKEIIAKVGVKGTMTYEQYERAIALITEVFE